MGFFTRRRQIDAVIFITLCLALLVGALIFCSYPVVPAVDEDDSLRMQRMIDARLALDSALNVDTVRPARFVKADSLDRARAAGGKHKKRGRKSSSSYDSKSSGNQHQPAPTANPLHPVEEID